MYFPNEDEVKALFTLITAASTVLSVFANRNAKRANHKANAADEKAEKALSLCSFPTCGHVCGIDEKPEGPKRSSPAARPGSAPNPGAA